MNLTDLTSCLTQLKHGYYIFCPVLGKIALQYSETQLPYMYT